MVAGALRRLAGACVAAVALAAACSGGAVERAQAGGTDADGTDADGTDADGTDGPTDTARETADPDEDAPDIAAPDGAGTGDARLDAEAGESDSDAATDANDGPLDPDAGDAGDAASIPGPYADPAICAEVERFAPGYWPAIREWARQDELYDAVDVGVLLVGSSSVRRWEHFARLYSGLAPLQRGFGGAQLGEVAYHAEALVTKYDPEAVAVFAGTNDVGFGVAPEVVVDRFRCFRRRVGLALGWEVPILFIGITPTPLRWSSWDRASAVNSAIAALRDEDPGLFYVDIPSAFLALGAPPPDALFVGDRLHLSAAGYALWEEVVGASIRAHVGERPTRSDTGALAPGERVRVDLGPVADGHGEPSPSPDHLGAHWNNWHPAAAGARVLPGERLEGLVTTAGRPTGLGIVITGEFAATGWANGGLRWPAAERLGSFAVGSATGDFFYSDDEDIAGGLVVTGLDPGSRYTLRMFGAREDGERRVTRYTVHGLESSSVDLQTSGPGAGSGGATTNDDDLAELRGVRPDAWGRVFVDVERMEGAFAYLSLLELEAE